MRYLILIICVFFLVGMGNVPPAPVCKNDPIVNAEIEAKIKENCEYDCASTECLSDCTTFSKWAFKYGVEH